MDLMRPLPETSEGFRWIFVVEDAASRYGTPRRMVSDNGKQFIADVMQQVAHCLDIHQTFIPLYHPESNPVERKNRDLKTQLAMLVENKHREWAEQFDLQ